MSKKKEKDIGLKLEAKKDEQYEQIRQSIMDRKSNAESVVVLSMYKEPLLLIDTDLEPTDFDDASWKLLFVILSSLVKDGKRVIDDVTMGLFVDGKPTMKKFYEKIGGWNTISNGMNFVQLENFDGYLEELLKYNLLINLLDTGFPIQNDIGYYMAMTTEELQNFFELQVAQLFRKVTVREAVSDMSTGYLEVIEEADKGANKGFPYNSPLLTEYTNGQALGNLTMVSANSGMGKTFFTISQILPRMIEFNEKLLIMANEEDAKKWKREILAWVANNVLGGNFDKKRFNYGKFTKEEKDLLLKANDWVQKNLEEGVIKFVNFSSFSMKKAIRLIKEYSLKHYKYFVLDTLKMDSDSMSDMQWLELSRNMVKLYDTCKPEGKNVHCYVTYQLGKSAMAVRFLSQNSLGVAKNVVDVVSTLLLFRHALDSEKDGGNNELKIRGKDKVYRTMDVEKDYIIIFIGKNRMGGTREQLVYEVDMGRNIIKEFGTVRIEQEV